MLLVSALGLPALAADFDFYLATRQHVAQVVAAPRAAADGASDRTFVALGAAPGRQLAAAERWPSFRPVGEVLTIRQQSAFLFDTPPYPPEDRFASTSPETTQAAAPEPAPDHEALSPQRTRFYFGLMAGGQRHLNTDFAPGLELSDDQFALSALIGVNIGRYLGLEVAADYAEADLDAVGIGTISEFSQVNLIPQVRLRYPFLNDQATAYIYGGVGYGQTEVNDATPASNTPGAPRFTGQSKDNSLVYAFGGGLEWFYADNIALTLDAKYTSQSATVSLDGTEQDIDLENFRILAGTRLLFPGPNFVARGGGASGERSMWGHDPEFARPYLTFQVGPPGAAVLLDEDVDSTFQFGSREGIVLGGGIGYDFNRYLGVELIANWHEHGIEAFRADFNTDAAVIEYGIWTLIPQVRLRYPMSGDRLVPYVTAGAGLGYTETNDPADETAFLDIAVIDADEYGFAASLGAGIEYMVADNIALGGEIKYIYHRPDLQIDGREVGVNADSVLGTVGVRVYY